MFFSRKYSCWILFLDEQEGFLRTNGDSLNRVLIGIIDEVPCQILSSINNYLNSLEIGLGIVSVFTVRSGWMYTASNTIEIRFLIKFGALTFR